MLQEGLRKETRTWALPEALEDAPRLAWHCKGRRGPMDALNLKTPLPMPLMT